MKKFAYCVYIGRFQPFHNGHLNTLRNGLSESEKAIIILGSSNAARSPKNPFTIEERTKMICMALSDDENANVIITEARDYPYDEDKWTVQIRSLVRQLSNDSVKVALIGYHKDDSSYYLRFFPEWHFLHMPPAPTIDGTDIRRLYFDGKGYGDKVPVQVHEYMSDFKRKSIDGSFKMKDNHTTDPDNLYKGLREEDWHIRDYKRQWKDTPFPVIFTTVDCLVMVGRQVLVVQRKDDPGKGLFALPGGFVNPNERLIDAAIRELYEETNMLFPREELRKHLVDRAVFDNPSRSQRGRTITHGFFFVLPIDNTPMTRGGSDASRTAWISVQNIYKSETCYFEDHAQIVDYFLTRNRLL